jgi:hypothetical protein
VCTCLVRVFATTARQLNKSFLDINRRIPQRGRERSRFHLPPCTLACEGSEGTPTLSVSLPSLVLGQRTQPATPHHGPRSGEEQGTARERTLRPFSMPHLACPCAHTRASFTFLGLPPRHGRMRVPSWNLSYYLKPRAVFGLTCEIEPRRPSQGACQTHF